MTLGGVAVNLTQTAGQQQLNRTEGARPAGTINATFLVEFWTQHGDPYTLAN